MASLCAKDCWLASGCHPERCKHTAMANNTRSNPFSSCCGYELKNTVQVRHHLIAADMVHRKVRVELNKVEY